MELWFQLPLPFPDSFASSVVLLSHSPPPKISDGKGEQKEEVP